MFLGVYEWIMWMLQIGIGPVAIIELLQFTSAEDLGCYIRRFTGEYKILLILKYVSCLTVALFSCTFKVL